MTTETSLLAGEETLHHTMQNYHQVLRRRLIWIGVLLLAILASLILDFTLGPRMGNISRSDSGHPIIINLLAASS